jgi:hypothetical protein
VAIGWGRTASPHQPQPSLTGLADCAVYLASVARTGDPDYVRNLPSVGSTVAEETRIELQTLQEIASASQPAPLPVSGFLRKDMP